MIKLFDCHCDTLTKAMENNVNLYANNLHLDFKRLNLYENPVQIFAIWLDSVYLDKPYSNTLKAIDFFYNEIKNYSEYVTTDYNDKSRLRAILSVEGGEACEGSIEKLYNLYQKGIRLMTLTWNYKNEIGCGALSGYNDGLSDFGKRVVSEMNNMNMLIDVSHLNERGFYDVYNLSTKPFIASHSNAYDVCNHNRNLKRDQLIAIKEADGIIGLNLYPDFVDGDKGNIYNILKHIDYILNIIDCHRLALGCDFDGISHCCESLGNIGELKYLYDNIAFHFSKSIAEDIFYNNMNNFMIKNKIIWPFIDFVVKLYYKWKGLCVYEYFKKGKSY